MLYDAQQSPSILQWLLDEDVRFAVTKAELQCLSGSLQGLHESLQRTSVVGVRRFNFRMQHVRYMRFLTSNALARALFVNVGTNAVQSWIVEG